ncbi:MAG: response regulator, partial [Deltaproteobacteria bacterium]|nr:response regulator [Deltaproteobacteria bacterium]
MSALQEPAAQADQLFEQERRQRNVKGLSTGVLVAAATMALFVPVEWVVMRAHFALLQSLTLFWIASLAVTWVLIKRFPRWALARIDDLVFVLFLFVSVFNHLLCWFDTGYDSPYSLTILFVLIGVNFFISWPASRSAAFGMSVYGLFLLPLAVGEVPVGDIRIVLVYQGVILGTALILVVFQKHRMALERSEFHARFEAKSANARLEEAYGQLKQLDQMKSEFFANISHELRTPLTLIVSPVDAMLSSIGPGADRDALKVVRRNASRLLRMIDDLLDLAKLEGGGLRLRVERVELGDLVQQVVGNAHPAAKAKQIELLLASDGEPVETFGDAHRLEIVLTNLVGNAMKFTPAGGKIDVRVRHQPDGTTVEITDTGPGISREQQAHIFKRFHQVERSERRHQGGVGIGLALALELAELHGGSLSVDSELGEGATFTLFLRRGKEHFDANALERRQGQTLDHPARRIEDRLSEAPTLDGAAATAGRRMSIPPTERVLLDRGRVPRILVAEDEDDLRGFMVRLLSRTYTVDAARNGSEALELMKKHRPDLVLTDVMMPEVSGLDLARTLKQDPSLSNIPVILLTARGENEAALEGFQAGADDFVAKPFHANVLQARIRAHLKMRSLSLQLADQARLASAGSLAAGLAHDVKNPLNAALNAVK